MKYLVLWILVFTVVSSQQTGTFDATDPVQLHRFIPSECNNEYDPYLIVDRIISKTLQNDSLYLTIGFSENCCLDFHPVIAYGDSTLDITLVQKETIELIDSTSDIGDFVVSSFDVCDCNCCFELTLILTGIHSLDFNTTFKGKELKQQSSP